MEGHTLSKVGIPKEIKDNEYRVAITLAGVKSLVSDGHTVYIEKNAGVGSGMSDDEYKAMGATILPDAASVFGESDLILKVKEPQAQEVPMLKKGNCSLPTYTWLLCPNWLWIWLRLVLPVSLTRQCKPKTVNCPCSHQCLKLPDVWQLKSVLTISSAPWAVAVCSSAASLA